MFYPYLFRKSSLAFYCISCICFCSSVIYGSEFICCSMPFLSRSTKWEYAQVKECWISSASEYDSYRSENAFIQQFLNLNPTTGFL